MVKIGVHRSIINEMYCMNANKLLVALNVFIVNH